MQKTVTFIIILVILVAIGYLIWKLLPHPAAAPTGKCSCGGKCKGERERNATTPPPAPALNCDNVKLDPNRILSIGCSCCEVQQLQALLAARYPTVPQNGTLCDATQAAMLSCGVSAPTTLQKSFIKIVQ